MIPLVAQAQQSIWPSVIQALSSNGLWVFVAICVLAGTVKQVVQMILTHRERITMIEAGICPDKDKNDGPAAMHEWKRDSA